MARSFCVTVSPPQEQGRAPLLRVLGPIASALGEARSAVERPAGGLVFVSGALTRDLASVVDRVRTEWRGVPVVIVPAAGVLTERGEIEGQSALAGVIWSGGRATVAAADSAGEAEPGRALAEMLGATVGDRSATAVLFARPDSFQPELLEGIVEAAPRLCVLGAGTAGGAALALTADGDVHRGPIAGLIVTGLAAPVAEASPACRVLTQFEPIDEASGGLVLRVGGRPALEVLSSCASAIGGGEGEARPLVFAVLADDSEPAEPELDPDEGPPARFVVRSVRGIDPSRRGVMVGPEAQPGVRLAFAVRDAALARQHLEGTARRVAKRAMGAAPRFALYLSCAGRGQGLYGAPDVDVRILRQRFGDLPVAGMHSSFEIAPFGPGRARMQLYTGVLALFRSPS